MESDHESKCTILWSEVDYYTVSFARTVQCILSRKYDSELDEEFVLYRFIAIGMPSPIAYYTIDELSSYCQSAEWPASDLAVS